eukprot:jgi/Chlat1/6064/Chrsp4S06344
MDEQTERQIAAQLLAEAQQLKERASVVGLAAYLEKRRTRLAPNARYLQATIRQLNHANRLAQEQDMWRQREQERREQEDRQKRRRQQHRSRDDDDGYFDRGGKREELDERREGRRDRDSREHKRKGSQAAAKDDDAPSTSDAAETGGLDDEALGEFLASRRVRGRGATGPRVDETGPFLPVPDGVSAEKPWVKGEALRQDDDETTAAVKPGSSEGSGKAARSKRKRSRELRKVQKRKRKEERRKKRKKCKKEGGDKED